MVVRKHLISKMFALLAGLTLGRASDRDEATITAKVSFAEHETQEGYSGQQLSRLER